ncbi:MAG TPA: hypothetical protein VFH73_06375, partial [Polyangia bacterium]|nr:hypothetical protein [Polyangia bacterium]
MRDRHTRRVAWLCALTALGCRGSTVPAQPRDVVSGHSPSTGADCERRAHDPPRTLLERPCGTPFAVLTDGARTVVLAGPERRFEEATAA